MRLGWLSDTHLNFLSAPALDAFVEELASQQVDGWLIGGDIGGAPSVGSYLRRLADTLPSAIYFILGNHDFYGSSLAVRSRLASVIAGSPRLVWLTSAEPVALSPSVGLVGEDSWAARFGDPWSSPVEIRDFHAIEDLVGLSCNTARPEVRGLTEQSESFT